MTAFSSQSSGDTNSGSAGKPVPYMSPFAWPTNNRTRKFIPMSELPDVGNSDLDILRASVEVLLNQQDERGSFYTDVEYCSGDKVDDQLGASAMVAFFIKQNGRSEQIIAALERAVRFHLDHLIVSSPEIPYRYSRYKLDRDDSGDWCNVLWCLGNGSAVLRYGASFLSRQTADELRAVLKGYWGYVSAFNKVGRDENPCHNQILAYCEIGIAYATAVNDRALIAEIVRFYRERVRKLRIQDRGRFIFSEFNQWDAHYGLLSWTILAHLYSETRDPIFAEDAREMALSFNERVSAGGYYWGGSRHNEGAIGEFVHVMRAWADNLDLGRLLLAEPFHLWKNVTMSGHLGAGFVKRIDSPLAVPESKRPENATPWYFRNGKSSVCLSDDLKLHHLSSAGLEIIPSANIFPLCSGVIWKHNGTWKKDLLQVRPPASSAGHQYIKSEPVRIRGIVGLASRQRGYLWETRQWWLSDGEGMVWVGHLISHSYIPSDALDFVIGTPVLTQLGQKHVPVAEVDSAEGIRADTQGDAVAVASAKFLKFGEVYIGATAPVEFVRPCADAFHTFPIKGVLRDFTSSNELRVHLSDNSIATDCRESLVFAIEIGRTPPSVSLRQEQRSWRVKSTIGEFAAHSVNGLWRYTLETGDGIEQLPQNTFGVYGV